VREEGDDSAVSDSGWMILALERARLGQGSVEPNPMVGAVIVRDGVLVGLGHHERFGEAHAEVQALAEAGEKARGATLYVTLEPCCHFGKTPPCSEAILKAGIRRVVAATRDPFPKVDGGGLNALRSAGLEVCVGIEAEQAFLLNAPYFKRLFTGRPYVTAKWAMTLDGKTAARSGDSRWISSTESRILVHQLRGRMDGVLIGIETAVADDPQLTDRSGLHQPARSGVQNPLGSRLFGPNAPPRRRPLLRVILDTRLRIPFNSHLVHSADHDLLILCLPAASSAKIYALTLLGAQVETVPGHAGRLSLPAVLSLLAKRDILSLLLECGSHLNGSFLRQNLVDKVVLLYAETELGEQAIPFAQGIASPTLIEQSLHRITRANYDPDSCITGYLHNPWPQP